MIIKLHILPLMIKLSGVEHTETTKTSVNDSKILFQLQKNSSETCNKSEKLVELQYLIAGGLQFRIIVDYTFSESNGNCSVN